jgi:membrane associated rhomboid family serine protease
VYGRGGGYGRGPVGFSGGFPPLTPMVRNIIVANLVVWAFMIWAPDAYTLWFAVNSYAFRPWQPFTYMWMHDTGSLLHILFNMLGLYFLGWELERVWGPRRFLTFYIVCGVGAGFIIWFSDLIFGPKITLGASGAVYGVITAYSLTWPDRTMQLLFPPIPIRAIYLIPFFFLMQLTMGDSNVSHVGHLGGVIVALVALRRNLSLQLNVRSLRYRWNRFRMRNRLRAVRREEWQRRNVRDDDDDDRPPTIH